MKYFIGILELDDWSNLKLIEVDELDMSSKIEQYGPGYGTLARRIDNLSFKTTNEFLIHYMSQWRDTVDKLSTTDLIHAKRTLWFIQARGMDISSINCQGCRIIEIDEPTKLFFKLYKYTLTYDYSDYNTSPPEEIKLFILATLRDQKLNKLLNS